MLTIEQALRNSALTLGLIGAAAGSAAAGGTPGEDETVSPPVTTQPQPTYQPAPTYSQEYEEPVDLERYGVAIALGGGVENFSGSTMDDVTSVAGSWNVRVGVNTPSPITVEGLYIGSAQSINLIGLDNDAYLVGNGLQGNLRLNFLTSNLQPFAYGGAAWRHYDITNSDFNTSVADDASDAFELPVGIGLSYEYRGLLLDARGEYRWSWGGDMMPDLANDSLDGAGMNRWGLQANVGYLF